MPSYRSITLSLISQYDILTIPEYAPPTYLSDDPFITSDKRVLVDAAKSLVSVYVPRYPGSQFWLRYSISPPHPPKALFYFKLSLNGKELVSWGCGREEGFKGKTMWGLYDSGVDWMGEKVIERRVLCFAAEDDAPSSSDKAVDDPRQFLEVRVYRAKRRQQIKPQIKKVADLRTQGQGHVEFPKQKCIGGVDLIKAGYMGPEEPQSFYKYALIDPLDQPFATFRYFDRSWDQLEALGVVSPGTDMPVNQSPQSLDLSSSASSSGHETIGRRSPSPLHSSESLLAPPTPPSDDFETLTQRSPISGPRGPRSLPRSNAIPSRNPPRSVKRSASMGLLMDVVSQAVRWRERGDGSPLKRSPLKRALSVDDSQAKSAGAQSLELGNALPSLGEALEAQAARASEGLNEIEVAEYETQKREGSSSVDNGSTATEKFVIGHPTDTIEKTVQRLQDPGETHSTNAPTSTTEEHILYPSPKPRSKVHRILGLAEVPEHGLSLGQRSDSRLGFHIKKSTDSLNSLFQRKGHESPDRGRSGSRASSKASSSGNARSDHENSEGIRKSDSKGRGMRFWRKG